jgi:predicted nucleotidyltransferase
MDKESVVEKVKRYAVLASRVLPVKKVILFGSHSRGDARPGSDIDVAVFVEKIEGDFLQAEQSLYRIRGEVDNNIEPVLIEDGEGDPSGFAESVKSSGLVVFTG